MMNVENTHIIAGSRIVYAALLLYAMLLLQPSDILMAQPSFQQLADPYEPDTTLPRKIQGKKLVWHDEFGKEGIPDSDNWGYEYGFVRNRELQWYQSGNAYCRGGVLIIEAYREQVDNPNFNPQSTDWRMNRERADYTSACLITLDHREWDGYGRFEVRARIDTSLGAWPAIWLLGKNDRWPACGEIDIMEFYRIRGEPVLLANAAWGSGKRYQGEWDTAIEPLSVFTDSDPEWVDKFHLYSMDWDKDSILLSIDDRIINRIPLARTVNPDGTNPFNGDNQFYLLLNLAIGANGGNPSATEFPVTFEVDYVRVYAKTW